MKQKNWWLIFFILIAFMMLYSCKKDTLIEDDNEIKPATEGVYLSNIPIDFTEKDNNNNEFTLSNLKGKVILLVFSTMWCSPCKAEAAQLEAIYKNYKDRGLEIVECLYQNESGYPANNDELNRWVDSYGISFPVIGDPDYSTVNTYKVNSIPTNIIIGKDFIIKYRAEGFSQADVIAIIEKNL
jgi:peroxiredoxin